MANELSEADQIRLRIQYDLMVTGEAIVTKEEKKILIDDLLALSESLEFKRKLMHQKITDKGHGKESID